LDKVKLKYIKIRLELEKQQLTDMLPEEFRERFQKLAYIAGGCIYSIYNNTEPKDYDFFLRDSKLANDLRKYFISLSGYHGKTVSGGMYKDSSLVVTENAVTLGKHQIITRWVGEPMEVCGEFDFCHLQYYYDGNEIETISDFEFLESKTLRYNESRARDIVGSVMRLNKFVERGMKAPQKEVSKMLLKLKEVGFNEREVEILEEAKERSDTDHFGS
jgi:hypothetical protein